LDNALRLRACGATLRTNGVSGLLGDLAWSVGKRPNGLRPRRLASAPASVDTVAAFRPWRGFRPSVARGRRGHHGDERCDAGAEVGERGGFAPPKRGLDAYTLSRRAPSTTRTPLRWNRRAASRRHTGPGILLAAPAGDKETAQGPGCSQPASPPA